MVILLKRYRLGASPPACDGAAASASRSLRSSRTTAASAVGFTCVARVCCAARVRCAYRGEQRVSYGYARVSYGDTGGTHALVAEAREDLERRAAEVRVEEVGHFLHGCVGRED